MNTSLTAKRLTLVFGSLFLFQASMVAVGLSLSHPKLFPSSLNASIFDGASLYRDASDAPLSGASMGQGPLSAFVESPFADDELSLEAEASVVLPPQLAQKSADDNDAGSVALGSEDSITHTPGARVVTVSPGDSLAGIFARLGAPHAAALEADKALKGVRNSSGALRVGEDIEFVVDAQGAVSQLTRELNDGRIITLSHGVSGGYEVSVTELSVIEEPTTVSGVIQSSLSSAAGSLNLPFVAVDEFVDLFSNRVEFRKDLQPGDTFSVTFMSRKNGRTGEGLKPGSVTSASLRTKGKLLVAVRHADESGATRFFDEQGNPLGNYFLRYPLQFSRISSAFSYARFHPVLKRARPHNGVDFAAPIGTPVRSVADGVVEVSGYRGAAGNMIRINHGSRWSTAYLHLNSIGSDIRPGARISRGQVIGAVGTTGLSTGPHLHFSLFDRGVYVDPLKTDLPNMQEGVQPLPREYLIAALEALDVEHRRVASVPSAHSAG